MSQTGRSTVGDAVQVGDLARLAELSPENRARLLGEDFDLVRALSNKKAQRRLLARLSTPEKMRILREMTKNVQLRRGARRSASPAAAPPRFGGRATAAGVNYETHIAAWFGVQMLAGGHGALWGDVPAADLVTITMQAAEPVDDIVLARKETDARIFLSAKSRGQSVPLTKRSPAFAEVIDSFVHQFLKLAPGERRASWLVWAIPTTAGERATRDLRRVLDAWRLCDEACPLEEFLGGRSRRARTALERLLEVARASWQEAVGDPPRTADLAELLRRVRVQVFDFDPSGGDTARAVGTLADAVVLDPQQAARSWDTLVGFFGITSEYGTPVTPTLLRKALTKAQIDLKPPADYAEDIARLQAFTERNLAVLAAHDALRPNPDRADAVHLDRTPELNALRSTADTGHLLITGEPGSGKSGLIHSLARAYWENATPVVLLLAEQISGRDWKGAANLPGFDRHPLDEILANWSSEMPGVLLTDALDAVRDPDTQRSLRGLLGDVKNGRSGWRVVASVREFDLDHGRELREMFPGSGVPGFASPRFANVAHFHVPRLSDGQLDALIALCVEFRPFLEHARSSRKSEELHRSPFYLRLAAELMGAGVRPDRVADWTSPAVLLRKYWEERVTKEPHAADNKHVLRAICSEMVAERSTVVAEQDVELQPADYLGIRELRSRGVLQSSARSGDALVGEEALGFTHHLLHDYAIASALIPKHPPERLVRFVADGPLLPIFYRQSFVFALEELWDAEGDGSRRRFWDTAQRLEDVPALHGITRIVAPVLAARRVEVFEDLRPLLDALARESGDGSPSHRALRHLVSGLQDSDPETVRVGAEGWLRFAVELSRLLPTDPTLEWPLVLLLDRLNVLDGTRPLPSRSLLSDAGRLLLADTLASAETAPQRLSTHVAITAVCQSFAAAPVESRAALLALLTRERLDRFPHRELSQLAHNLHHLGREGDEIVRLLFEAVFTREKQPGEWEERGTILMSMQLQTSDQWNSIRHTLADYYRKLNGEDADIVTELACMVLNEARQQRDEAILAIMTFRGVACALVEDFASFRGHGFDPDRGSIFSRFEEHLRSWAAADDQARLAVALDRFTRCSPGSSMWSAFLKAGAEYPTSLGILLEPVLSESVFLIHSDYRYAGVEFFGALHRTGDHSQRERLERLILTLPERYRPWQEASDDQIERWVSEAQKRLLGTLDDTNIVLAEVRLMKDAGPTVANERPGGFHFDSHTFTDAELMERRGIPLSEPANDEMFRLRNELKHFLRQNNQPVKPGEIERRWPAIIESEQALERSGNAHPEMARELWGHLVGASGSAAANMDWPAEDERWQIVHRILLAASTDPDPAPGDNEDDEEVGSLSWVWPAPRIDAAEGLVWLAFRIGTVDEPMANALRVLRADGSHALRHNLTRRLSLLHRAAPALMWELLEIFARHERRFIVLIGTVEALNRLWEIDEERVSSLLSIIAERASMSAPADHEIRASLMGAHLFHYLRTGSAGSARYVSRLIETCDEPPAAAIWPSQLHSCRAGGWLTLDEASRTSPEADAARQRTWRFFFELLSVTRAKLESARVALRAFGQQASEELKPVRQQVETRDRLGRLVNDIAMQIYFASGAFNEKHPGNPAQSSPAEMHRFWKDSKPCLTALSAEVHPSVAYHLVQTFVHLLPCGPAEIFLLAARSIRTSTEGGGFQYESQAVSEVVKLVQRILADHSDLLLTADKKESEVFTALLDVLDRFVEAGWAEARHLTHRLEEIYR